jgi:GNAT superfamily N-acetyltransferase
MTTNKPVAIVEPSPQHKPAWRRLYQGYADFYRVPMTDENADRLWSWINDPAHVMEARIALNENGEPIGFAHFRTMPRPLFAAYAGFLDDLFVDPTMRGSGAVDALLADLRRIGRERGWGMIRWNTADNNYRARTVYDRVGERTMWITYQMDPKNP